MACSMTLCSSGTPNSDGAQPPRESIHPAAIIILTPVLLPAAGAYGFDPVHFGVVLVFGLVIGLLTPPVGLCLFVGCSIGNVTLEQLTRAVLPFLAVIIAVYLFFVFVPAASLWLPRLLMG